MILLYPYQRLWFLVRAFLLLLVGAVLWGLWYDIRISWLSGLSVREIFWMILIPGAIFTMYFSPLLWRNVCPLSTVSLWRFTLFGRRRLTKIGIAANERTGWYGALYDIVRKRGLLVSALLFWTIVPYRLISFNADSQATFWLLVIIFAAAFIFGSLFPVKSGWCTSLCPIAAAEKAYGMNPAVAVKNYRCHFYNAPQKKVMSCSGCSFNCGDVVEPEHAYWQASSEKVFHDTLNAEMRKLFVATLPGFMVAFFLIAADGVFFPAASHGARVSALYAFFLIGMSLSALVYYVFKAWRKREIFRESVVPEIAGVAYAVSKRRLDLVFVTFAMNVIWIALSFAWTHSLLARLSDVNPLSQAVLWTVFVFSFFFVSLAGLHSGWNEKPGPGHYRTRW